MSGYQEMEEGVDVTSKGHTHKTVLGGDETPLHLDLTGGYTNFYEDKLHRTMCHIHTRRNGYKNW